VKDVHEVIKKGVRRACGRYEKQTKEFKTIDEGERSNRKRNIT
jgi:hypothetical protein